jgi:hypothetical protein
MFKPVKIESAELEDWNDATAAAGRDGAAVSVDGNWLNALICEVQNWRHENPQREFVSGPNTFKLNPEQ